MDFFGQNYAILKNSQKIAESAKIWPKSDFLSNHITFEKNMQMT